MAAAVLPGSAAAKTVALTFDDGPSSYTADVLRKLERKGVPATFFVVGEVIAGREHLLRRMDRDGHEIGNHTWSHPFLTRLSDGAIRSQLGRTNRAIRSVLGYRPTVFRPPYGDVNDRVRRIAGQKKLKTVLWNVDTADYSRPGCQTIYRRAVASRARHLNILMHDGGGPRDQTVCAVPKIIRKLKQRNYRFVTVSQQLRRSGTAASATSATSASATTDVRRDHAPGAFDR